MMSLINLRLHHPRAIRTAMLLLIPRPLIAPQSSPSPSLIARRVMATKSLDLETHLQGAGQSLGHMTACRVVSRHTRSAMCAATTTSQSPLPTWLA
jgi:hypothetical protein